MKILLILASLFASTFIHAAEFQTGNLRSSLMKKNEVIELYDFYTYIETAPLLFEGKNVFEALTFRGEGIQVFLSESENAIKYRIEGKEFVLSKLSEDVKNLPEGYNSIKADSSVKVRLDHASLGKPYKTKVTFCLPGFPCWLKTVKVVPHRTAITVTGSEGDMFCIKRGFNENAENHGKVDDTYSLGACR